MRKDAFNLCLTTFVLGIFGFFLRWLQNMNGFEAETGLVVQGAKTPIAFLAFSLAALLLMLLADRFYLLRRVKLGAGAEALTTTSLLHKIAVWILAIVWGLCCLVLMFSARDVAFPMLWRIASALGILSAAALPMIFSGSARETEQPAPAEEAQPEAEAEPKPEPMSAAATAALIPMLFGCVWMLCSYLDDAENPVLWQYVVGVLAALAVTVALSYLGAYFFKRCKPNRALAACQIAAYLCICTLADGHSGAEKLLYGVMAALMLGLEFVIVENAKARE